MLSLGSRNSTVQKRYWTDTQQTSPSPQWCSKSVCHHARHGDRGDLYHVISLQCFDAVGCAAVNTDGLGPTFVGLVTANITSQWKQGGTFVKLINRSLDKYVD